MNDTWSAFPAQFINWTFIDRGDGSKPAKVPVSPVTRQPINHLDPAQWMTRDAAVATGLPVGVVITKNDPFVLIDVDDCRDPVTGNWSPEAQAVAALFPGAFMEVSISGTGLHVVCTAELNRLENKRRKWAGQYEVYTHDRFIALGQGEGTGDIRTNCTEALVSWVPNRPDAALTGIPDVGPVPEWDGSTDDVELISHALSSHGSVAVKFGNHASFRQLWTGDAEALAKFYPSYKPGDPFDRSGADGALVMHLGFWTGKDMARVERLWRAAPLTQGRGKLDRDDYVHATITTGLKRVTAVYKRPVSDGGGAPPMSGPAAPVPSDIVLPGTDGLPPLGYLTTHDQVRLFAGCVYVDEDDAILCPDGQLRDRKRFAVRYGGYEFQMTADGTKPTKDAWEAFTQNRVHRFPQVQRRRYWPNLPFGAIIGDGVNMFRAAPVARSDGDVTPFLDLVRRVLPDERDQHILLTYFAAMVQNPGVKFQWAIVLQGCEGNGKTFLLRCLSRAVGESVTHLPNPEDLQEKYNSYIEGNLLIGVEEIHMEGRRDVLDRLKKYITNDRIEVRGMRADKRMTDNLTNWLFLTNYKDAVFKSRNDRRYSIFFTAQQVVTDLVRDGLSGDYFPRLWDWAKAGGYEAVAGYLSRYQCDAAFNPAAGCHRAPDTSSTAEAISESRGAVEQIIMEAVETDQPGFRNGWISSWSVRQLLDQHRKNLSPLATNRAICSLGYVQWGRASNMIMQEGGIKPILFCTTEIFATNPSLAVYLQAQHYDPPALRIV